MRQQVPPLVAPPRNMTALGWLGVFVGLLAIFTFVTFVIAVSHTSDTYNVGSIALDDTKASLRGSFTFLCNAGQIQYTLQYSVPSAETVTRMRLEYSSDVGPNPPDPIPLCRNDVLDPINPYRGPRCPSAAPCDGEFCYVGTLSAAGQNAVTIEYDECDSLCGTADLWHIRVYTDLHPQGIAIGSATRH